MTGFLDRIAQRLADYPPYYSASPGDLLRLDQNTNRWGPPAYVRTPKLDLAEAHLYPQRDNQQLLDAFAEAHGLDPASVFVGNGSDQVLDDLIRLLVEPEGRVVTPAPSYSLFPHLCRLARVEHAPVAYGPGFSLDPDTLIAARPALIILANPDNPSGTVQPASVVEALVDGFDGPIVIDEAYGDYIETTWLGEVGRRENLIVTRTLSKAYGMAGLRVGFGAAHPTVAELMRRAKIPFAVNVATQALAIEALRDGTAVAETRRRVARARQALGEGLQRLGLVVVPSQANFVLAKPPMAPTEVRKQLQQRGILVRTLDHDPSLRDYIRITVGPAAEMEAVLSALEDVLSVEGA